MKCIALDDVFLTFFEEKQQQIFWKEEMTWCISLHKELLVFYLQCTNLQTLLAKTRNFKTRCTDQGIRNQYSGFLLQVCLEQMDMRNRYSDFRESYLAIRCIICIRESLV